MLHKTLSQKTGERRARKRRMKGSGVLSVPLKGTSPITRLSLTKPHPLNVQSPSNTTMLRSKHLPHKHLGDIAHQTVKNQDPSQNIFGPDTKYLFQVPFQVPVCLYYLGLLCLSQIRIECSENDYLFDTFFSDFCLNYRVKLS